jgi:hypothetical protein
MAEANNADTFIGGTYLTPLVPDREKLAAARQYCAEAHFQHQGGNTDEALYQLICAVDHMIAAWQQ